MGWSDKRLMAVWLVCFVAALIVGGWIGWVLIAVGIAAALTDWRQGRKRRRSNPN